MSNNTAPEYWTVVKASCNHISSQLQLIVMQSFEQTFVFRINKMRYVTVMALTLLANDLESYKTGNEAGK